MTGNESGNPSPVSVPVLMREEGNSPRGVSKGGAQPRPEPHHAALAGGPSPSPSRHRLQKHRHHELAGASSCKSTFDRAFFQASPDDLPVIAIHSL